MAPARSLHEIFAGLPGDAAAHSDVAAVLDANGYADLSPELLAQAVVSFADTAPAEVAEHLAPFVTAHSQVGGDGTVPDDLASPLDLLATAPAPAFDAPTPDDPAFDRLDLDGPGFDAVPPDGPGFDDPAGFDTPGFDTPAGFDDPGFAAGPEIDAAFGRGDGPTVDDRESATVDPSPAGPTGDDVEPASHDSQPDAADLLDGPLPSGDPWAMPSISEGTAGVDGAAEIDDLGAG
ncbi:hypothetical protein O7621_01910 [Solwaraspora sp. WMMD937]|uniref:hypothetical protein n=1 Tax=Solwaraspora sp. WMMD937 TaxID=3016090 RepID=UPI00249B4A07|nr:hypothetical protein [Solwaraspora sp. WMMD937]WFE22151.1 hypothetical protein O7621_01910 [Solwaraspora sp. WMMD937]